MKVLLALAAAGEAVTGIILLAYPPIVVKLLFGAEIAGVGVVVSRIAGISLIALGLACWPGRFADPALRGMLTYSVLATLYLLYLGITGEWAGKLLWLAIAVHAALTILFIFASFKERKSPKAKI